MTVSAQNGIDHLKQSMQLMPIGYVDLFMIEMRPRGMPSQFLYLTGQLERNWQGKKWESVPVVLVGYGQNSSGERNRPKLSIVNPLGLFSKYVHQGWTDNAAVTRYRVLTTHLEGNINSFVKNVWRISKPLSVTNTVASFELRSSMDGQAFFLPARAFFPPEFPHVSL